MKRSIKKIAGLGGGAIVESGVDIDTSAPISRRPANSPLPGGKVLYDA